MKENVTQFDLSMAFKELNEIAIPTAKRTVEKKTLKENLKSYREATTADALLEDYYDVSSHDELEQAKEDREDEIAKAKLARIEKIVDLDAETADDILPSYVGKMIIQCPQCMTLFYKDEADIEYSEENSDVVNINETCQHCGNTSGYTLIGKVDKVGEDEADQYDASAFKDQTDEEAENELDLNFDEEPEVEETDATEEQEVESEEDVDLNLAETSEDENAEEDEEVEESLHRSEAAPSEHETENKSENLTLNEDMDKDLDEKLKAHTEYIEYLRKEIECAECELDKASNDFVKEAIQRKLDSLKADLEAAIPAEVKDAVEEAPVESEESVEESPIENPEETEITDGETEESEDVAPVDESLNKSEAAPSEHESENKAESAKSLHEELEDEELTEALGETELKAFRDNKMFEGLTDEDIKKAVIMYVKFRQLDGEPAKDKTSTPEDVAEFIEDCGGWGGFADEVYNAIFKGDIVGKPQYKTFINWLLKDEKYIKAIKKYGEEYNLLDDCTTDQECIEAVFDESDMKVWKDTFKEIRRTYIKEETENNDEEKEQLTEAFEDMKFTIDKTAPSYSVVRIEGGKQVKEQKATKYGDAVNVAKKMAKVTPNAQIVVYVFLKGDRKELLIQYQGGKTWDHTKELLGKLAAERSENKAIAKADKNANKNNNEPEPNVEIKSDNVEEEAPKGDSEEVAGGETGTETDTGTGDGTSSETDTDAGADAGASGETTESKRSAVLKIYRSIEKTLKDAGLWKDSYKDGKKYTDEFKKLAKKLRGVEESLEEGAASDFAELQHTNEFNSPVSDASLKGILSDLDNLFIEDLDLDNITEDKFSSIEDIDEDSIEKCLTESLTNVYKNVKSFTLSGCENKDGKLIIEGIITFNSGKTKSTSYTLSDVSYNKDINRYVATGLNESLNKGGKFELTYFLEEENTKLFTSSAKFSYMINESLIEGSSETLFE